MQHGTHDVSRAQDPSVPIQERVDKKNSDQLILPSFLFRFAMDCRPCAWPMSATAIELDASYRLPSFAELDGGPLFADLRLGWHAQGLVLWATVRDKRQTPWCRAGRIEDSDGVRFWIDTRDTHQVHRATRFCHQFVLLPAGGGPRYDEPVARLVDIERANELPQPKSHEMPAMASEARTDGYILKALIPADIMAGYDTSEHRSLGFFYGVLDRELGWQTLSLSNDFPFSNDPSLWATLELIDN